MKSGMARALGTALILLLSSAATAHDIVVRDAWVRAAPPNAAALGAFMVLENFSDSERSIVAARTSLAVGRVELHRTMMIGDVMQMVPQERIPLPPRGVTELRPGSWHVMLMAPRQVPRKGASLEITLVFDDGFEHTVEAVVREGGMKKHQHQHEHGMQQQ